MRTRVEIESILNDAVNEATDAVYITRERMNTLIADIPSGIPATDSNLQMKQASEGHLRALGKLRDALRRWSDFAVHGNAPADLIE